MPVNVITPWVKILCSPPSANRLFSIADPEYMNGVVKSSMNIGILMVIAVLMLGAASSRMMAMSPPGNYSHSVLICLVLSIAALSMSLYCEHKIYTIAAKAFSKFSLVPAKDTFYSRMERDTAWFDEAVKKNLYENEGNLCVRQYKAFDDPLSDTFNMQAFEFTWEMLNTVMTLEVVNPWHHYNATQQLKNTIVRFIELHHERFLIIWGVSLVALLFFLMFGTVVTACVAGLILCGVCGICRCAVTTAAADACLHRDSAAAQIIYYKREYKVYMDRMMICYDHLNDTLTEYQQRLADQLVKSNADSYAVLKSGDRWRDESALVYEKLANLKKVVNGPRSVLDCIESLKSYYNAELLRGLCASDALFMLQFLQIMMMVGVLVISAVAFFLSAISMKISCPSAPCPGPPTFEDMLKMFDNDEEIHQLMVDAANKKTEQDALTSSYSKKSSLKRGSKGYKEPGGGFMHGMGGDDQHPYIPCGNPTCRRQKMCTCPRDRPSLRVMPPPGAKIPVKVRVDKEGRIMAPFTVMGKHGIRLTRVPLQQLVRRANCQKVFDAERRAEAKLKQALEDAKKK